jgi:hypothetical protein
MLHAAFLMLKQPPARQFVAALKRPRETGVLNLRYLLLTSLAAIA